jgi:hypothetical protein
LQTIDAIQNYIDENGIEAELVRVGSLGMCSFEPIVDIQLPGKNRISLKNVTADMVPSLLDGALNNYIQAVVLSSVYIPDS